MPYGLPEDDDTPENNDKMERCVEGVMEGDSELSKSSAIAICKSRLGFVKKDDFPLLEIVIPASSSQQ